MPVCIARCMATRPCAVRCADVLLNALKTGLGRENQLHCVVTPTPQGRASPVRRNIRCSSPHFQSAVDVSYSYLQVLGSPTCPCKFLKTLVIHTLKRMAAAVELRPWPPSFQRTWSITNAASRPRDACAQEVAERLEQDFVKDAMDYF